MRTLTLILAALPLVGVGIIMVVVLGMSVYTFLASLEMRTFLEFCAGCVLMLWVVWGVRHISSYREV